jgi:hypothetical protein
MMRFALHVFVFPLRAVFWIAQRYAPRGRMARFGRELRPGFDELFERD